GDGADATLTIDITVPAGATLGSTRMRVAERWYEDPEPCTSATWGEVEDYEVEIVEEYGIKWEQLPDLSPLGMDVDATNDMFEQMPPHILADDFLCTQTGYITDIHFWGSWFNDMLPYEECPEAVEFTISIHADIPANPPDQPYSMPGEPLWMRTFIPYYENVEWLTDAIEDWYDPATEFFYDDNHYLCFKYNFYLQPEDYFYQEGTIDEPVVYWLDIQAVPLDDSNPDIRFGWKTSLDHWNDDAVWAIGEEPCPGLWNELRYPMGHPFCPESIDLAFELTTLGEDTTPPEQYIELGTPIIEDIYNAGGDWLDLIGTQTPVWINSTDPETGTEYIEYILFWSDHFGDWVEYATYTVEDNQEVPGNPFLTDTDDTIGRISIEIYFDFSCFHQIHALCFNNIGLSDTDALDFLVDADAPPNDEFAYVGPLYIEQSVRYISHRTVKRIWANDTGCTEGVAGVCRIEWEVEYKTLGGDLFTVGIGTVE
ncbi:MAG: hypothetical protein KAW92_02155, partial [Candidatus Cloacimonetes bacterium]|nr:hypothetical protein [Candidatus Cloacimonadota bacterium]